jgi:hemerythrin-like domain-containing protein
MTTKATTSTPDAISLLIQDHENVKRDFEQFEKLGDRALASKKKLADKICMALNAHASAEEEIFYPAVDAVGTDEKSLIEEATVEHACAKDLIAQILSMEASDEMFDAKVKVLSEQIEHHVQEEEQKMFPRARKAGLDLIALGKAIAQHKQERRAVEA